MKKACVYLILNGKSYFQKYYYSLSHIFKNTTTFVEKIVSIEMLYFYKKFSPPLPLSVFFNDEHNLVLTCQAKGFLHSCRESWYWAIFMHSCSLHQKWLTQQNINWKYPFFWILPIWFSALKKILMLLLCYFYAIVSLFYTFSSKYFFFFFFLWICLWCKKYVTLLNCFRTFHFNWISY